MLEPDLVIRHFSAVADIARKTGKEITISAERIIELDDAISSALRSVERTIILQAWECPSCKSIQEHFPDEITEVISGEHAMECRNCHARVVISVETRADRDRNVPSF